MNETKLNLVTGPYPRHVEFLIKIILLIRFLIKYVIKDGKISIFYADGWSKLNSIII